MPESSRRKRAPSKALRVCTSPGGEVAHVVGLVGDQQGRPAGGGAAVGLRPGGDRLVGDGDAVEVGRLGPVGVRPVRLEVDPVARRVGGPLAADVGGRPGDDDPRDEPGAQHPVGDVEAEGGLAGRRRRRGQEARAGVRPHRFGRLLLPGAERSGGGPVRERAGARRAAGKLLRDVVQGRGTIRRARPHRFGRLLLPGAEGPGSGPIRERSGARRAAGPLLRFVVQGRGTIGGRAADQGRPRRRGGFPSDFVPIADRRGS